MYYNVIVRDTIDEQLNTNQLIFTFCDIDEALSFSKQMIEFNCYVEILHFEDEGE